MPMDLLQRNCRPCGRAFAGTQMSRRAHLQPPRTWQGRCHNKNWKRLRCTNPDQEEPSASSDAESSEGQSSDTSSGPADPKEQPFVVEVDKQLKLPADVIERLKYTVFGLDTFWVTSVENYEQDGVVFKGNVKGKDLSETFAKLRERMCNELGDEYQLFLVQDREEKPTALVMPSSAANAGDLNKTTEVWLFVLFALGTALTTCNSAGIPLAEFLLRPFYTPITASDVTEALPTILGFWFILGAHEWGHFQAAKKCNMQLYLPFFIPSTFGFLGSFGTITRFKDFVLDREALLRVSVAGPALGTAVSLAALLVGYGLTAAGWTDATVDSPTFATSLFVALTGQLFLGAKLAAPTVEVNSLVVVGWAGLLVNALNCIPTGELDGGRMALALWGRPVARLLGLLSIGAITIASFGNALAFYWVLVILILQRGPILPCREELSAPRSDFDSTLAKIMLLTPLVVLPPFPIDLIVAMQSMPDPTPF